MSPGRTAQLQRHQEEVHLTEGSVESRLRQLGKMQLPVLCEVRSNNSKTFLQRAINEQEFYDRLNE